MTAHDLADVCVSEGDEQYHLDWYYQSDPRKVTTPANFDLTTLQDPTKGWVKLSPVTPASSYVNGYVKTLEFDDQYPHVKVPTLTIGASSTTYYCDYAYLVLTLRCARFVGVGTSTTGRLLALGASTRTALPPRRIGTTAASFSLSSRGVNRRSREGGRSPPQIIMARSARPKNEKCHNA